MVLRSPPLCVPLQGQTHATAYFSSEVLTNDIEGPKECVELLEDTPVVMLEDGIDDVLLGTKRIRY